MIRCRSITRPSNCSGWARRCRWYLLNVLNVAESYGLNDLKEGRHEKNYSGSLAVASCIEGSSEAANTPNDFPADARWAFLVLCWVCHMELADLKKLSDFPEDLTLPNALLRGDAHLKGMKLLELPLCSRVEVSKTIIVMEQRLHSSSYRIWCSAALSISYWVRVV